MIDTAQLLQRCLGMAVLILAASGLSHTVTAREIGITSAVRPAATGKPPGGEERVLQVGLDIFADERVDTGPAGQTHLLFRDGSALSVGPNASLVLDTFVYDDDAKSGELVISASKGLLRFVGGRISKKRPVVIKTPTALIGIRGGVAMVEVNDPAQIDQARQQGQSLPGAKVTMLYGEEVTMQTSSGTQRMTRPGFTMSSRQDGSISPPQPASQEDLGQALSTLEDPQATADSTPEALSEIAPAGGGPVVGDEDVAGSQLDELGSGNDPENVAIDGSNPGPVNVPSEANDPELAQNQRPNPVPPSDSGPSPGGGPVASPVRTGLVGHIKHASSDAGTDDSNSLNNRGFVDASIENGDFTATFSDGKSLVLPIDANGVFTVDGAGPQPFGMATLSGEGGATETLEGLIYELVDDVDGHKVLAFAGVPTPVSLFPDTGMTTYSLDYDFPRGSDIPFADHLPSDESGTVHIVWDNSAPNSQRAFGGGQMTIQGMGPGQVWSGFVLFGYVADDANGLPHIMATTIGQSKTSSTGLGASFAGAVSSVDLGDGSDFIGESGPLFALLEGSQSDVDDNILNRGVTRSEGNSSSLIFPNTLIEPTAFIDVPFPVDFNDAVEPLSSRSSRTISGFRTGMERASDGSGVAGLIEPNPNPIGFRLTTNAAQNTVGMPGFFTYTVDYEAGNPGPPTGTSQGQSIVNMRFGESTPSGRSAFINDGSFFAGNVGLNGTGAGDGDVFIATGDIVDASGILPSGVAFCACDYTVMGFWGGRRTNGGNPQNIELATWVAGAQATDAQTIGVASTTSASYSGHIAATLVQDFNDPTTGYLAVGNISIGVTFSPGSYSVDSISVSNLDQTNYSSVLNTTPPTFTTSNYDANHLTITGNHPVHGGVRMFVDGAGFFGPGTPPEETAGGARIVSTNLQTYKGVATFAAHR